MNTLTIRHIPDSDPPQFQLAREDHKSAEPTMIASPFDYPVEGRPDSNLMEELPWYLEDFLEYPFSPNTDRAEHILDALKGWGTKALNDLIDGRDAAVYFHEATKAGYQNLCLRIMSDDPRILQWPWEVLLDSEATFLAVSSQIERRMNKVRDPLDLPEELPRDRINILLVTARPYENDVHYRSISRLLVELIEKENIPAHVHVLRPPTFANLRSHLAGRSTYYHIIHFDGHGGYGQRALSGDPTRHVFHGPEGVLIFEDDNGKPDGVSAEQLTGLLRDHAIPLMVLNACQSAMLSQQAQDPFASVAASLVKAGIRGVVAMAYSLYVSGAQEFLPAFYKELFETGDLSQATRAGRQKMFEQKKRVCARGRFELNDFIVPVIYRQEPYELPFAETAEESKSVEKHELPEEAKDEANPYGFIGRDRELLKLERALRKDTPAILIHGLGGVGKTTLASGFVRWLNDTEGMQACLWLSFKDIRSAEYVINSMGSAIFGKDFLVAGMGQKIEALACVLREHRIIIVWDNFEVVAGIPGTYIKANLSETDRGLLLSLLEKIRGGKGKVIITSRSEEQWLGVQRLKVSIGGLVGEERWEYCETILDNLNIAIDREDKGQVELMKLLGGHPLAMRVILPRLEGMSAGQVIDALNSNMDALGPGAESLYATIRFAEQQLEEKLKPLLVPLGLHEGFVDADLLEHMAQQVDEKWNREIIDEFLRALAAAGLMRDIGGNTFELHPALTGYLRSTLLDSIPPETRDTWGRAFVDVMGRVADTLAPRELHEQRFGFHCHGANFHFALSEAERLEMEAHQRALIQSLAAYARHTRNFSEAFELFEHLADMEAKRDNKEREASAYHQLGIIAEEQRDFKTAEKWYLKALEILEKHNIEQHAADTYHQLGMIAEEQRDFKTAEKWYLKALAIDEKQGNEQGAAQTYHQLGRIVLEQRDFNAAEQWCLKAIEIKERMDDEPLAATSYHLLGSIAQNQGNMKTAEQQYLKALHIYEKFNVERHAAMAYHQLGMIAEEQRDFKTAETWYLKSLAIKEKLGDELLAASTYHHLGMIAEKQRDFKTAETWYLKSLAIKQKQGNEHGAAGTYGRLGNMAGDRGDFEGGCKWLIKAIRTFEKCNDPERAKRSAHNYLITYRDAPPEQRPKLKAMWEEAGLGPFPEIDDAEED